MVFFTCNGCGESLKKAQVEKHLVSCRSCSCLSCIDCGKDFWGDKYKTHLKCLTEDEKYGGKAFEVKANKGDVKQQQWIQRVQEAMKKPDISDNIRNILSKISTYNNVPRKKAKFENWMINCLRIQNQAVQDAVWECFSEATSNQKDDANNAPKPSNTSETQSKSESSTATEETEKKSKRERKEERQKKNKREKKELNSEEPLQNGAKKKGKKRKMEDDESGDDEANDEETGGKKKKKNKKKKQQPECEGKEVSENGEEEAPRQKKKRNDSEGKVQEAEANENGADDDGEEDSGKKGKFNWRGTIRALLKKAPDNELPIKKLRKKVIAQYHAVSSEQHRSEEELLATFNKKIKNNPKFRVLKDRVKLVK